MDFTVIKEKTGAFFARFGKRTAIIACAVLVVAAAVALNFLLRPATDDEAKLPVGTDLSDLAAAIENEETSPAAYYASVALNRRSARDESISVLSAIVNSTTAIDEMKAEAADNIQKIAKEIEAEANIETLIMAKGFSQCIAVLSGNTASVIVEAEELLPNQIAQIKEIVYEQAGIMPENMKIVRH